MRERNMSAAARGLKDVAGELGVPVLALVQLNRNRATRADKRPQLADLRESADSAAEFRCVFCRAGACRG
jgi:replicative DNA helicase